MFDEISRNTMRARSARKRREITPNSKIVIDLTQTTLMYIHEGYWSLTNIPIPNNSGGTFELRCVTKAMFDEASRRSRWAR